MADQKISDLPLDASIGGSEKIPMDDAGTAKHATPDKLSDYTIDNIEAISAGVAVDGNDKVYILDNTDSALKPVDIDLIAQHAIDTVWGKADEASPDGADILLVKDGGTTEKTMTAANFAEYVRSAIEAAILNFSDLSNGGGALADADIMCVTQGGTGKRATLLEIVTYALADLQAYVTALAAVTTSASTDILYCIQGGVQKKVTLAEIDTLIGGSFAGPASSTDNGIPQWNGAGGDTLKDGLTLVTTISSPGDDTTIPSAKAVDTKLSTIVYDQTDIGAALADADEIAVDDGGLGTTQRKFALSRLWTYVTTKIKALTAKTSPVDDDILTIQDSEASNVLKELTIEELRAVINLPSYYHLVWVAGQRGKPGLNADIQNAAEATRMVTDPDFEILGTNASSDDVTYHAEGGIQLQTDGADGDEVILLPHLDTNQTPWSQVTWGTDRSVRWECRIRSGPAITNSIIWAGLKLTNTEVTATDNEQAFFRYEDGVNGGEWQAISSIGGSDDAHDTNVVVAVDTEYRLVIDIQSDRTARFYINDTLVETSGVLTDATDLIPYIGIATDGAAETKTLIVRGQTIRRDYA